MIAALAVYGIRPYPGHYHALNISLIGYGLIRGLSQASTLCETPEIILISAIEFYLCHIFQKQILVSDTSYCYRKLWKHAARRKKGWKTLVLETPASGMLLFGASSGKVIFSNSGFESFFPSASPATLSDTKDVFSTLKLSPTGDAETNGTSQKTLWEVLRNVTTTSEKEHKKAELGEFVYQPQPQEEYWKHFTITLSRMGWKKMDAFLLSLVEITSHKKAQTELICKHYRNILLTTASHELMTPLNGILGGMQLIEKSENIYEIKKYIDIITRSCRFLINITEDMHDYCLYESGCLVLCSELVNLRGLMEDAVKTIQIQAQQRGVAMNLVYDEEIPEPIYTDKKRLMQVFLNLLSNAAKYTFKGSITFTAKYKDPLIMVEVADTGIGISEAKKKNLFKLFGDTTSATTNSASSPNNYVGAGSGLGLTVSQALTKLLGTGLSFTTEENVGSRFSFGLFRETPRKRSKSLWGFSPPCRPVNINNPTCNKRTTIWAPPMRKAKSRACVAAPVSSPLLLSRKGRSAAAEKPIFELSTNHGLSVPIVKSRKSSMGSENLSVVDDERNQGSPRRSVSGYKLVLKNSFSSTEICGNIPEEIACNCPELLVVDDNAFNLWVMQNLLAKLGLSCETVFSLF